MKWVCTIACMMVIQLSFADRKGVYPAYLRAEYKENPFTDVPRPRLSWELEAGMPEQFQTAYQILVASSPAHLQRDLGDLWDSGKVDTNATNQIEYGGAAIAPKTRVYWKVRSWDKRGRAGAWSNMAWWETGFLNNAGWNAGWIGFDLNAYGRGNRYHLPPAPYLRKEHRLDKAVKSARLYITALGVYEFFINGQRVGDDYFAPGWTDYNRRVYYQAYDVTDALSRGPNAFAATLSYGWYAGYLGYALLVGSPQVRAFYGDVPQLKAQLEITYVDGSRETVVTDGSWKAGQGPLRETDFQHGEQYDARLQMGGWDQPGFDDQQWEHVRVYPDKTGRELALYPGNPVKAVGELEARSVTPRADGKYIIDFGQNFAGIVRLRLKGREGDTVVLRYGEMLHPDGSLVTENLRMARATDTYVLKGDDQGETWQPQFTFHGFRYVEVSGLREAPGKGLLTGIVLSSVTPEAGTFETDNAMLNQLYSNIVWTQRANYFDIPTDCPQRDERLGWTGDAQVYIHSATFNNDVAAFHTKWLTDLHDAQWRNGAYPVYAPMPVSADGNAAIRSSDTYSPGWSEAGVICVYELYRTYADTRMIRQSWPFMTRFMDFLRRKGGSAQVFKEGSFAEISPKGGFGDWLSIGRKTPPDLLATLYYGYCAGLMAEMAKAIGEYDSEAGYSNEREAVRQAFLRHYTDESGRFIVDSAAYGDGAGYVDGRLGFYGHTQTAYANAIYMQLLDTGHRQKAGRWLRELVQANDNKLTTGFLGFRPLLPALSATGSSDLAYHLLLSTDYPSLGFEVANGATSIWERWDSYTKDKGFVHNASMNSFSHYAFGAVNEWMFGNMAGIRTEGAGYRTFVIRPEIPAQGVSEVNAQYRSINGWIGSSWKKEGKGLLVKVAIPVNTSAAVYVPAGRMEDVSVNGKALKNTKFYKSAGQSGGYVVISVGSGSYEFVSTEAPAL